MMQLQFGLDTLEPEWASSTACIGTFDGLHLGHQKVISTAVETARMKEQPAVCITFDRHPSATLFPERAPLAISTLEEKLHLISGLGVDLTVIIPFDKTFGALTADEFLQLVLRKRLHVNGVVVGHDFAFGKGREGTCEWISERLETVVVPAFELEGSRISSSGIRDAIVDGDLEKANKWLGRTFSIAGTVVGGQKLGRELGYPTANIARSGKYLLPGDGVYAAVSQTPHGHFHTALSIGTRPTVDGVTRVIEAYFLDYPGMEIYGRTVSVVVKKRVRGQEKFVNLELLKAQIKADVEEVRRVLR